MRLSFYILLEAINLAAGYATPIKLKEGDVIIGYRAVKEAEAHFTNDNNKILPYEVARGSETQLGVGLYLSSEAGFFSLLTEYIGYDSVCVVKANYEAIKATKKAWIPQRAGKKGNWLWHNPDAIEKYLPGNNHGLGLESTIRMSRGKDDRLHMLVPWEMVADEDNYLGISAECYDTGENANYPHFPPVNYEKEPFNKGPIFKQPVW